MNLHDIDFGLFLTIAVFSVIILFHLFRYLGIFRAATADDLVFNHLADFICRQGYEYCSVISLSFEEQLFELRVRKSLARLESQGLVMSTQSVNDHHWTLTEAGRARYLRQKETQNQLIDSYEPIRRLGQKVMLVGAIGILAIGSYYQIGVTLILGLVILVYAVVDKYLIDKRYGKK